MYSKISFTFLRFFSFALLAGTLSFNASADCEGVFSSPIAATLQPSNPFFEELFAPKRSIPETLRYDQLRAEHFLPALRFSLENIEATTQRVATSQTKATFSNTADPILNALSHYDRIRSSLNVFGNLMSTPEIDAATQAAEDLDIKRNQLQFLQSAIYSRLKEIDAHATLPNDQRFILKDWIKKSELEGLALSYTDKIKLAEIDKALTDKTQLFRKNFNGAQGQSIYFPSDTKFENGMPESFLKEAKSRAEQINQDGYTFLLKPKDIDQLNFVLEYASDENVRRKMFKAFTERALSRFDNRSVIREIVNLRIERSRLLGFQHFADSVLPSMMAGSVENVQTFLSVIKPEFHRMATEELKAIAALKKELTGNDELPPWDVQYFAKKLEVRRLAWDVNEAAPYLEVHSTLARSLGIIGDIYHLSFSAAPEIPTWNPDVLVYAVKDLTSRRELGYIYYDLLVRPGKATQAFAEELKAPGMYRSFGGARYRAPGQALVNLGVLKGAAGEPNFFSIRDLQSLFHETGHALHSLFSEVQYPSYSSFHVAHDLVELPSQLLENWVYLPEVFDKLARHHITGEAAPRDWLKRIPQIRSVNPAIKSLGRRAIMTELDLAWHTLKTSLDVDVATFEDQATRDWADIPYLRAIAGTSTINTYIFSNGYESRFHCYQWCQAHDADAFEMFLQDDPTSPQSGRRFKEAILSRGAILEPAKAYREFRGRDANPLAIVHKFE